MFVVPHLSWPILFGESHLHATKALVDHDQPSITFQHPSMQFTVPCSLDNPLTGFTSTTAPDSHAPSNNSCDNYQPHVGITCLLNKTPLFGKPTSSYSLQRGLNLVTVCLTLSSVFVGFQGTKPMLWLEGQPIEPGIKVLDGPFDWQSAPGSTIPQQPPDVLQASLCDIQEN